MSSSSFSSSSSSYWPTCDGKSPNNGGRSSCGVGPPPGGIGLPGGSGLPGIGGRPPGGNGPAGGSGRLTGIPISLYFLIRFYYCHIP